MDWLLQILLKRSRKLWRKNNDFYCLQTDTNTEICNYLNNNIAVRFAKNNIVIPNIELKFVRNKVDMVSWLIIIRGCFMKSTDELQELRLKEWKQQNQDERFWKEKVEFEKRYLCNCLLVISLVNNSYFLISFHCEIT